MALELRNPDATDLPDWETWRPASPEDVWFVLSFEVGEVGEAGANRFDAIVATPESIRARRHQGGRPTDTKLIVVDGEYSWDRLLHQVRRAVASCDVGDWSRSVEKLAELFHWEYEGYKA